MSIKQIRFTRSDSNSFALWVKRRKREAAAIFFFLPSASFRAILPFCCQCFLFLFLLVSSSTITCLNPDCQFSLLIKINSLGEVPGRLECLRVNTSLFGKCKKINGMQQNITVIFLLLYLLTIKGELETMERFFVLFCFCLFFVLFFFFVFFCFFVCFVFCLFLHCFVCFIPFNTKKTLIFEDRFGYLRKFFYWVVSVR